MTAIVIVVVYLVILVVIGVVGFRAGDGSADDYFVAGRSVGPAVSPTVTRA